MDAQTAIAFLTTRVRNPDEGDCKKLRIMLGYLKRTIKLPQILQADGINVIKWWVDALYAAHDVMRGAHRRNYANRKIWVCIDNQYIKEAKA